MTLPWPGALGALLPIPVAAVRPARRGSEAPAPPVGERAGAD